VPLPSLAACAEKSLARAASMGAYRIQWLGRDKRHKPRWHTAAYAHHPIHARTVAKSLRLDLACDVRIVDYRDRVHSEFPLRDEHQPKGTPE